MVLVNQFLRIFTLLAIDDFVFSSKKFKTFFFGLMVKLVDPSVSAVELTEAVSQHIKLMWSEDDRKKVRLALSEYDDNLLVYLNEFLLSKHNNRNFDFSETTHVEHIMPASGRNKAAIMEDANIKTIEEFLLCVNRIGNKMLLEADINVSISNSWFKTKKNSSVQASKGYKDSRFTLAAIMVSYPSDFWGVDDIELATEDAAERIYRFIFDE